jgi:hypothetical protein
MKEEKKGMTLQELTTRLQSLCHDGYSQEEILFFTRDLGLLFPEEVELRFRSAATKDGYITVKLG